MGIKNITLKTFTNFSKNIFPNGAGRISRRGRQIPWVACRHWPLCSIHIEIALTLDEQCQLTPSFDISLTKTNYLYVSYLIALAPFDLEAICWWCLHGLNLFHWCSQLYFPIISLYKSLQSANPVKATKLIVIKQLIKNNDPACGFCVFVRNSPLKPNAKGIDCCAQSWLQRNA